MANSGKTISQLFSKLGGLMFNALSRCQDSAFLSKTARFLKVSLLGLMVALIAACAKKEKPGPGGHITTCYMIGPLDPTISEVSATPNPTRGAHMIRIRAKAKVLEPTLEDNYVSDAWLQTQRDTNRVRMYPVDGRFSDTMEMIEGRINVSGIKVLPGLGPETIFVYVHAATSKGKQSLVSLPLFISEEESK